MTLPAGGDGGAIRVNTIGLRQLLDRYEAVGFLYPAKRARLARYADPMAATWSRTLQRPGLREVYSCENGPRWASVDLWRSSCQSWTLQHLVATGGGTEVRTLMLALTAEELARPDSPDIAWEAWFRPSNPFPAAVFGGSVRPLGAAAGRADHAYVAVPFNTHPAGSTADPTQPGAIYVFETDVMSEALLQLASASRHQAYPVAAALHADPLLDRVDRLYRQVGLRRYRRIFVAEDDRGRLLGAALAHRGPLGLNFSFLENRCDVLLPRSAADIPRGVTQEKCWQKHERRPDRGEVARALIAAAARAYDDFLPGFVPVVVAVEPGDPEPGSTEDL